MWRPEDGTGSLGVEVTGICGVPGLFYGVLGFKLQSSCFTAVLFTLDLLLRPSCFALAILLYFYL